MLNPSKRLGSLCLGVAVALGAPSANAVIIWDQEAADFYGVEQPYEYTAPADCTYLLKGNLSPEVGTAATYEIWQHLGSGEEFPLYGMAPGSVAIWDSATQRLVGYPVVQTEQIANFTYTSGEAAEHTVWITDNDPITGNKGESYDMFTVNGAQIGERWCEGRVFLTWQNTVGKVTGGGWIADRKNNFGFNAQFNAIEGLTGHLTYIDKDYGKLESTALDYLMINGTHATLIGVGALNDQPVSFTVEVDDLGEPGAGLDQFKITWTGGYSAGSVLNGGNIQIHE